MEGLKPLRKFERVAFVVQTIGPLTSSGNIKVTVIMDLCSRFVRAVSIPDKKPKTLTEASQDYWISIFGPMGSLVPDREDSLTSTVFESLAERVGIKWLLALPLHPQVNGFLLK